MTESQPPLPPASALPAWPRPQVPTGFAGEGVAQLLGLCPLLAISHDAVNALGLGVATMLALTLSNPLVSSIRGLTRHELRLPVFMLIIAAVVTGIELAMRAWWPELFATLGLFVPLIAGNCVLLGRAEAFASRQPVASAARDGFRTGLAFLALLLALGVIRELLASGQVFAGAGARLHAPWLEMRLLPGYQGFLLAALPTGAFLALAALLAARQSWRTRGAKA